MTTVTFDRSASVVEAYDYVEVTLKVAPPLPAGNPFTDVAVTGTFHREGGGGKTGRPVSVEGFCDSTDGSLYRIRFLPTGPGDYRYSVVYRQQGNLQETTHEGRFHVRQSRRKGLLRVDSAHPWHFLWAGTGEHYFWNGTTTYFLLGWDDGTIRQVVDRLHRLKVNRLRVAINGRVENGQAWHEPVYPSEKFSFLLNPWVAARPNSVTDPGFDVTRFNVAHWHKIERLLRYARERDMIVSIIFYVDGARPGVDPFGKAGMGGADEQRYYRYAAARLSAFSNVLWDVTNEYHLFRNEAWTEKMGAFLKACDPYDHLTSVHGHEKFPFRTAPWADFAMYQAWDESGGHDFLLRNRQQQAQTGRPLPQVNEEYGYEDHYPHWGGDPTGPPRRSADNRRRLAWGMYMAGCYQTTGERANDGAGKEHKRGGGWINGRGDDTMTMLEGYRRIVDFFTRLPWWRLEPHDELVKGATAMCLAEPKKTYVVYLPQGGRVAVKLEPGRYRAQWYDPRAGRYQSIGPAEGQQGRDWTAPEPPGRDDWVLLLTAG